MAFRNALPLWERRLSGDGVVALEGRGHELLDAGEKKTLAVDGVVEQTGRFDTIIAQRVEEGRAHLFGEWHRRCAKSPTTHSPRRRTLAWPRTAMLSMTSPDASRATRP
jgi:hypothetical protein